MLIRFFIRLIVWLGVCGVTRESAAAAAASVTASEWRKLKSIVANTHHGGVPSFESDEEPELPQDIPLHILEYIVDDREIVCKERNRLQEYAEDLRLFEIISEMFAKDVSDQLGSLAIEKSWIRVEQRLHERSGGISTADLARQQRAMTRCKHIHVSLDF